MKLYTIGHSTAELPALIDTLRDNGVDVLVDVRSKPRSRMQHFDFGPLQAAVEQTGIRYRFLGDRLGGMPRDPEIAERWRQGKLDPVIVAHLRATDEWADGLDELARLVRADAGEAAVCIMCSEANPDECHRKAVALDMTEVIPGLEIEHLSIHKSAPSEVGVQEVLL
ncbi:MAG TPA: DUF488 domain-containing protein [Dehalococcoidia bacterium]|nr:DUF488 domain-containing protein [Dehalococcoidia bacterium]